MAVVALKPRRQYSFTDHAVSNPSAPPPGDRLDSEVDRIDKTIAQLIDWVGVSLNTDGSLKKPDIPAPLLIADGFRTPPHAGAFLIAGADPTALAMDWAEVSWEWAEHMPDTIPPNILATMGITGDHWSSRWWAHEALKTVETGAVVALQDVPPQPPHAGQLWWDTTVGQLYIYYDEGPSGSEQWVAAVNAPGPQGASGPPGPQGPPGSGTVAGMVAGQIPIASGTAAIGSSANLSGDLTSNATLVTTLATVNATTGTFQGLTVNSKGLVTAAVNQGYATLAAMNAADALAAPLASPALTGNPTAPTPATADNDTSIATTAFVKAQNYIAGNQAVTLSGDITGSGTTAITTTLATVNAAVGTFQGLTVNAKGLVTGASNQNYVTQAGATFTGKITTMASVVGSAGLSVTPGVVPTAPVNGDIWTTATSIFARIAAVTVDLTANQAVTLSGDISGSGTTAITATLPNVNGNVGTFQGITVNSKGLVTAAANQGYLTASGVSGMTSGQIPIAAGATTITSSGNLSGAVTTAGSLATTLSANVVGTTNLVNSAVTYAKIQNVAANRILGNSTGSAAAVAEIALPLAVALGGTGSATAAAARTALGAVNIAGDTMTGTLTGTDIIVSGTYGFTGTGAFAYNGGSGDYAIRTGITAGPYCYFTFKASGQLDLLNGGMTMPGGGLVVGAPTGGMLGVGKINAVEVRANNVVLTSDAELKTDIEPLTGALPLVAAIEPKSFRWQPLAAPRPVQVGPNGETVTPAGMSPDFVERTNRGFLAQEVVKALGGKVEDGVDMGSMVAVLWQAVRELSGRVRELEGRSQVLDFPDNPVLNQIFVSPPNTWYWDGTKWVVDVVAAGGGGPFLPLAGGELTGDVEGHRAFFGNGTFNSNWLETTRGVGAASWCGLASLTQVGGPPIVRGIVGAMRTSDPNLPDPNRHVIGLCGFGYADYVPGYSVAWGGYFEAWRGPGVNPGSLAIGIEIDIAECNAGPGVIVSPFDAWPATRDFTPAGLSCALWLASGANLQNEISQPIYPASLAIGILDNGAKFHKGIVFKASALDTAIGSGTNGVAIEMARGQSIRWMNPAGVAEGEIWADGGGVNIPFPVVSSGPGASLNFVDRSTGDLWGWVAVGGNAELYQDGPKLVVDLVGDLTLFGTSLMFDGTGVQVYNAGSGDLGFRAGVSAGPFKYTVMKADGEFQVLNGGALINGRLTTNFGAIFNGGPVTVNNQTNLNDVTVIKTGNNINALQVCGDLNFIAFTPEIALNTGVIGYYIPASSAWGKLQFEGTILVDGPATINDTATINGATTINNVLAIKVPDNVNGLQVRGSANFIALTPEIIPLTGMIGYYLPASGTFGTMQLNGNTVVNGELIVTVQGYKPGGGAWGTYSDRRLKESVVDYETGLDALLRLRPVTYRYNGRAETPVDVDFVGLVGDEVLPVMPEMVGTRSLVLDKGSDLKTSVLTLDMTALPLALVNAVRELASRLTAVEGRLP